MILDAKDELKANGLEVTTKEVSNLTGIKLRTVQIYFKKERIDFEKIVTEFNYRLNQ